MDPLLKVVNGKLICPMQNHNEPVEMIVMDDQVPLSDRLLCQRCFKAKRQVSKYISIEETQILCDEKFIKLTNQQEEQKQRILEDLNDLQSKMMSIRSRVIQKIDEILRISQLWITDIRHFCRNSDINNFIEDLKLLSYKGKVDLDFLNKSNQSHQKKIDLIVQKLMVQDDYKSCLQYQRIYYRQRWNNNKIRRLILLNNRIQVSLQKRQVQITKQMLRQCLTYQHYQIGVRIMGSCFQQFWIHHGDWL